MDELNLKVFPNPSSIGLENYYDKKNFWIKTLGFGFLFLISILILFIALSAFVQVRIFSFFNVMVILFLCALVFVAAYFFKNSLRKGIIVIKGKIVEVRDITSTYEKISEEEKGKKTKLEIFYETTYDELLKSQFVVLFEKNEFDRISSELPDVGDEIPVVYDKNKRKVVDIFIPLLKYFIESY